MLKLFTMAQGRDSAGCAFEREKELGYKAFPVGTSSLPWTDDGNPYSSILRKSFLSCEAF